MIEDQDFTQVKFKDATKAVLLWLARIKLGIPDIQDSDTKVEVRDRLYATFGGEDQVPEYIKVPRVLVQGGSSSGNYEQAPQDQTKWPGQPGILNNGFDEHGNEYWAAVHFRGRGRQSSMAIEKNAKNEAAEFTVNGSRIVLRYGDRYCIRGRFVQLIQNCKQANLPDIDTAVDEDGNPIDPSSSDWVPPKLETPQRFDLYVIGYAGPTGSKADRETVTPLKPNRNILRKLGVHYNEQQIVSSLDYISGREKARLREQEQQARKRARSIMEQDLYDDAVRQKAKERASRLREDQGEPVDSD